MVMSPTSDEGKVWFEGKIVDWDEAKIHIMSHVAHYGSGVFEGIRSYDTPEGAAIFRLREHIDRLLASAKCYRMDIPHTKEELIDACREVVKANGLRDAYIRPIAFRDAPSRGLFALDKPVKVAIGTWPWGKYLGEAYREGARCIVSSWRRISPYALPTISKACGHYLNSQLARMEAYEKGCDEAIMLDYRGYVSEGTGENIFLVRDGDIYTPPMEASILVGITRDTVMKLADDSDYPIHERNILHPELYVADEVFLTGTAAEVTPVVEVDNIKIGDGKPGPITRALQKKYEDVVRGRIKRYRKWLTYA